VNLKLICAALIMTSCVAQAATPVPALSSIAYPIDTVGAEGALTSTASSFELTAKHGTDLFLSGDGASAADNTPRVLFRPVGDFILSAKVTAQFKREFDGASLIVYGDGRNWAKLLYEQPRKGTPGISSTVAKGVGDDAHHGLAPASATYLKIARMKEMYVFYASDDGVTWRMVRNVHLPSKTPMSVGFSAQSPEGDRLTATFSEIKFRPVTFKDFWQGE
jgi:regulation of enolase protein 1 (concanavalin A-like superfamily)